MQQIHTAFTSSESPELVNLNRDRGQIPNDASRTQFLPVGHFRVRGAVLLTAISVLCFNIDQVRAQESAEIAKQAQNPIANLISVPVENDFYPQSGFHQQDSYVLELKPVIPFRLSNNWNLITRTIIPVIQEPDLAPGVSGTSGLGDIQESLFFSPQKAGAVIWGVGPAIVLPTATDKLLGAKKVSVGPSVVVLRSHGHWLFGSLAQNVFSVAGPAGRPDVSQMLIQPFVNYNMRHGWYLTSSPIITANWKTANDQTWTVSVGGGVGKIMRFGKLPVNIYTQLFRNVSYPYEVSRWSARLQAQFLFPKGKREK